MSDHSPPGPAWLVRSYRLWLTWYPAEFRHNYGQAMEQTFGERLGEERHGSGPTMALLVAREAFSIAWTGFVHRLGSTRRETRRAGRALGQRRLSGRMLRPPGPRRQRHNSALARPQDQAVEQIRMTSERPAEISSILI